MKIWQQNWPTEILSKLWKTGILPGLSITSLLVLARLLGALQPLEWTALDWGLKRRPTEATDPRITIVNITEDDIQTSIGYPISDKQLAELIQKLQTYSPRVVGIDIFRDVPVGEGYQELAAILKASDNVVGINKVLDTPISPSSVLPEERIGFADAILDGDGFLRRSLLATEDDQGDYRFSLTIRLVEKYLAREGIVLENGILDPETMRFGETEIPRFQPNEGGYAYTDNGGNQVLINFRAGTHAFEKVSYKTLMSGQINSQLIEDRVVLIGYTAESVKDFVSSNAIATATPSLVPGVEIQAHAISQILSAIYDDRPFLRSLPDGMEYLFILGGGLLGMALAYWHRKPSLHMLLILLLSVVWFVLCYGLLMVGLWLPLTTVLAAFLLNTVALYPFYRTQQLLGAQLSERQILINSVYSNIHNGPLQTLASLLSDWPENQPAPVTMRKELETLNKELREIYEAMRQEIFLPRKQLIMAGQRCVSLEVPLSEILYETYKATLERRRSFFEPILQITSFEAMSDSELSMEQKRGLARFLEEALINVYKYAKGTTRLTVSCCQEGQYNLIQVKDNDDKGLQQDPSQLHGGYGTQQAKQLARQLGGQFKREELRPQGICCELRWPTHLPAWQRWLS